jgi:integrase
MHDDYRRMAWTLATTGMRPKEYWGEWSVYSNYIHIHGTKTAGADRVVPSWWGTQKPVAAGMVASAGSRHGIGGQVTPYDLRRTYANWLEDAGIPRTRRRLYLGHGAKDTTDLYEWRELRAHLELTPRRCEVG